MRKSQADASREFGMGIHMKTKTPNSIAPLAARPYLARRERMARLAASIPGMTTAEGCRAHAAVERFYQDPGHDLDDPALDDMLQQADKAALGWRVKNRRDAAAIVRYCRAHMDLLTTGALLDRALAFLA